MSPIAKPAAGRLLESLTGDHICLLQREPVLLRKPQMPRRQNPYSRQVPLDNGQIDLDEWTYLVSFQMIH